MPYSFDGRQRPRPIKDAADEIRSWLSFATLLVGGLTGAGINLLTDEQASALTALLAAVPGIVGAVTVALTAFGIVRRSEPLVTPLADPMDASGAPLVVVGERGTAGGMLR
jgi:hypothetical protein